MLILLLASLFNTITLQDFGAVNNTNTPLQPKERFNPAQVLRTNDFQPLQQISATDRQGIRMGAFYISQGPDGVGITFPSAQANSIKEVRTDLDQARLIIGATESVSLTPVTNLETTGLIPLTLPDADPTTLPIPNRISTQSIWVLYFLPGDPFALSLPTDTELDRLPNTMVDYNIIGNAYHDIRYNNLTPTISFGPNQVTGLFVDDVEFPVAANDPRSGRKFKFNLDNGQTYLLYVEESDQPLTLFLDQSRTLFTSLGAFTGVLRFAAIQSFPPPATLPLNFFPPGDDWSTAIFNQTYPALPIGMYLFWPIEWIPRVGLQIKTNLAFRRDVPTCNLIPPLLPVLARSDFRTAELYFAQVRPSAYDFTTNPFVTFFMMLTATTQDSEITTYQMTFRPQPSLFSFSAEAIEQGFDDNRKSIPISAEILFEEDRTTWFYRTRDTGVGPLLVYPAYKTLDSTGPVTRFGYADAIKGPLNGVVAGNNQVSFKEGAVPEWYKTAFFPDTLAFSTAQLAKLHTLFSNLPLNPQITTSGVSNVGQQMLQYALTVRCAISTFEQSGFSGGVIRDRTLPYIEVLKETLNAWLNPNVRGNLPDSFVGDLTTGGIVTTPGVGGRGPEQASIDENNALYSNHHIQYGLWLFAAATVMEWDEKFQTPDPFITTPIPITDSSRPVIMKDLIDMLWRDANNPELDDPQLPYNRSGNPWEGHNTQNGSLYTPIAQGRNEEFFGQDFLSWVATTLYARAVRTSSFLTDEEKAGFEKLEVFATTNTQLTATSGELIFHDNQWIYFSPFSDNTTVGQVFDTEALAETTTDPGTPSCQLFAPGLP